MELFSRNKNMCLFKTLDINLNSLKYKCYDCSAMTLETVSRYIFNDTKYNVAMNALVFRLRHEIGKSRKGIKESFNVFIFQCWLKCVDD